MHELATLPPGDTYVLAYDRMVTAIAQAHRVDDVKDIRDRAAALRQYARQVGESLENQNRMAEIKLRAERRAGELLGEFERNEGAGAGRPSIIESTVDSIIEPSPYRTALIENNIANGTAGRWQQIARLPEAVFESHIAQVRATPGEELTTRFMLRRVVDYDQEVRRAGMADPGAFPAGKFRVIYADPPWPYESNKPVISPNGGCSFSKAESHYPTMSLPQLCALEVSGLALPDAVCFLWATVPLLPEALQVLAAWGFQYKTHYVWHKLAHHPGYYSSVRHELLLIGTRGSCVAEGEKPGSVIEVKRSPRHSEKPTEFRELIDTLYPYGPRIELFRRGAAPAGWQAWGNEVPA